MTVDYTDETRETRLREEAELEATLEVEDMRLLLGNTSFRRFVQRLLGKCGVMRCSYETGEHCAENAIFREGERNVGLYVLDKIMRANPAILTELMRPL